MIDGLCIIQDRISRMPIRVGEEWNGLSFYKPLQLSSLHVCHMKASVSSDFWCCRLDHPSYNVDNKFFGKSSNDKSQNNVLFVCELSKLENLFP